MDQETIQLFENVLKSKKYLEKGRETQKTRQNKLNSLLSQQNLPDEGWDEADILWVLDQLASMDTNNQKNQVGVGEREGRVICPIVQRRHFYLSHGIGRSGDITEIQPKAVGSSILYKLTNKLILGTLKIAGISKKAAKSAVAFPMATGMTLSLCMQTIKKVYRPESGKYVLWMRIDQKSCFKAIFTAGLVPVVIENILEGQEITTNLDLLESKINTLGDKNIVCVYTTTSCFAPRRPDKLVQVAKLCKKYEIPHLVNNAYGLQSKRCMGLINEACISGRVDCFVFSTDKNYCVPVGGAVVAGPNPELLGEICKMYPGRASASQSIDVFTTLLYLGKQGFKQLLCEREDSFQEMKREIIKRCEPLGIKLLDTPNNDISMALSLEQYVEQGSFLGSKLFLRNVSGARSVIPGDSKTIETQSFKNWCQHIDNYNPKSLTEEAIPYLNVAVAVGFDKKDIHGFIGRLEAVLRDK